MTSRAVYLSVVRDRWLDGEGAYKYASELHLKNGHWDRFFDSLIGPERDCIFPELPRIVHEGADGFTVSKKGQMELYSNLRLSKLDPSRIGYGDLAALTKEGYIALTHAFLREASRLRVPEEWVHHRHAKLVLLLPAASSDKDPAWNAVLNDQFGLIGVGGYGGWEGYVKVRGIFRGAVFVRWGTNLILLVGKYSPYYERVVEQVPFSGTTRSGSNALPAPSSSSSSDFGSNGRGLVSPSAVASAIGWEEPPRWGSGTRLQLRGCGPSLHVHAQFVTHYTRHTLNPAHCALSCLHLGFGVSGIVSAEKCACMWRMPAESEMDPPSRCSASCGSPISASASSTVSKAVSIMLSPFSRASLPCGGANGRTSFYSWVASAEGEASAAAPALPAPEEFVRPPPDAVFLRAEEGQSCTEACAAAGAGADLAAGGAGENSAPASLRCAEGLFPLLHRSCAVLQSLTGCTRCGEEADIERGFATPGMDAHTGVCAFAKGKYVQCARKPHPGFLRVCVCAKDAQEQLQQF